jgi:hypothetical protein
MLMPVEGSAAASIMDLNLPNQAGNKFNLPKTAGIGMVLSIAADIMLLG